MSRESSHNADARELSNAPFSYHGDLVEVWNRAPLHDSSIQAQLLVRPSKLKTLIQIGSRAGRSPRHPLRSINFAAFLPYDRNLSS